MLPGDHLAQAPQSGLSHRQRRWPRSHGLDAPGYEPQGGRFGEACLDQGLDEIQSRAASAAGGYLEIGFGQGVRIRGIEAP